MAETKKVNKAEKKTKERKHLTIKTRRSLEGIMFVSPWIIGSLLFFIFPLITSIRLSFSELTSMAGFEMEWVGLDNYRYLFEKSTTYIPNFLAQVKDTVINTPITLVFSLIIAMLVNRDIKGKGFFRTVFFLPVLLGTGYVMQQLLSVDMNGVITIPTGILQAMGATFAEIVTAFLSRITVVLWKSGVQIILFLAGLQGISSSLYEASRVDGATEWENFWKITLPLVSPIILLNFVYTMIDSFTDSSNQIMSDIEHCFENGALARGAAMGWFYFAFTFILCMLVLGVMSRITFNQGER